MKLKVKQVLIWFALLLLASGLQVGLRMAGIGLGAIPVILLYVGVYFGATSACRAVSRSAYSASRSDSKGERAGSKVPFVALVVLAALAATIAFANIDGVRIAAAVALIVVGVIYIAYVIWDGEK